MIVDGYEVGQKLRAMLDGYIQGEDYKIDFLAVDKIIESCGRNEELDRIRKKRKERRAKAEAIIRSDPDVQLIHRIEAAIKNLKPILEEKWLTPENIVDLCRYFLTGEKDQKTWKDADLGL